MSSGITIFFFFGGSTQAVLSKRGFALCSGEEGERLGFTKLWGGDLTLLATLGAYFRLTADVTASVAIGTGQVGAPLDDGFGSREWSPNEILVPSLGVRRQVAARVAVGATASMQYAHFLEGARTTPMLTLGLIYR